MNGAFLGLGHWFGGIVIVEIVRVVGLFLIISIIGSFVVNFTKFFLRDEIDV